MSSPKKSSPYKFRLPKFDLAFMFTPPFFEKLEEEERKVDDLEESGEMLEEQIKERHVAIANNYVTLFEERYGEEFRRLLAPIKDPLEGLERLTNFLVVYLADLSMRELLDSKKNPEKAEARAHTARGIDRASHEITKLRATIKIFLENKVDEI